MGKRKTKIPCLVDLVTEYSGNKPEGQQFSENVIGFFIYLRGLHLRKKGGEN